VLNVNDAAAAEALIDAIVKEFGALNVLVNNAGITQDQLAMRMKDEDWDAVIDTNLKSVFRCRARCCADDEGARRAHHQHHVGGRLGRQSGQANYAAAKAGVAGMTRALAREIGSRGITVNCVAPGFIDTDMTKTLPEEQQAALKTQIPLGRLGSPKTSPMPSRFSRRRRPVTSPARRCTSTAACTCRNGRLPSAPYPVFQADRRLIDHQANARFGVSKPDKMRALVNLNFPWRVMDNIEQRVKKIVAEQLGVAKPRSRTKHRS
jgi:NAD(P)-dependent dehydrogenase (short-subunit alcohol dehydrogenase family)